MEAWARQAKDGDLLGRAVRFRKWSTRRLGERMEDERAAGRLAKGRDAIRVARGKQTPELKPTLDFGALTRISPMRRASRDG